jgi:S1-C subfamily serine protease
MNARRFLFSVLLLSSGFVAGIVLLGRMQALDDARAQTPPPPRPPVTTPAPSPAVALPDFSRIAEQTVPAVVNVSSVQYVQRRYSPFANDPLFQLFGDFQGGGRRPVENSLGSGVMVSSDGYILTNNHVVTGDRSGAPRRDIEITIALSDNREMPARIIGTDPGTDLALLKVDGVGFRVMPWGDSQKLKVADWVLAIGNPYQLSESVSLGIVSAVNRTNVGINTYENFIQTDAAINPGNSGGALVNARGELVGINTAIFSQSGGYQGIGFAVASHLARAVMVDLQQYGQVRRGTIRGIVINRMTTRLARQLGAPDTRGVVVVEVDRRYNRTFEPGDVIVAFNNADVADPLQLVRLVGEASIGSDATITVLREGRRANLTVRIEPQQ